MNMRTERKRWVGGGPASEGGPTLSPQERERLWEEFREFLIRHLQEQKIALIKLLQTGEWEE